MLPLYPPYPFLELAREQLGVTKQPAHHHQATDPDGFHTAERALAPDPVFMGLRGIFATGPIGAAVQWFDRKIEAWEDRRYGQTIDHALRLGEPDRLPEAAARDDEKIAA